MRCVERSCGKSWRKFVGGDFDGIPPPIQVCMVHGVPEWEKVQMRLLPKIWEQWKRDERRTWIERRMRPSE